MPTQKRSTFKDCLLAIGAELVKRLQFPQERVLTAARDVLPHNAQADQYVVVRPSPQVGELGGWLGGGRTDARVTRRVLVTARTRLALDEADRDLQWLTKASMGHLDLEHAVIDALWGFRPRDSQGNQIVCRPMQLKSINAPVKDGKANPEWGESRLEFDVYLELALDQTRQ